MDSYEKRRAERAARAGQEYASASSLDRLADRPETDPLASKGPYQYLLLMCMPLICTSASLRLDPGRYLLPHSCQPCSSSGDEAYGPEEPAGGQHEQHEGAVGHQAARARPGEQLDEEGNVAEKKPKAPRPKLTYGHLTVRDLVLARACRCCSRCAGILACAQCHG